MTAFLRGFAIALLISACAFAAIGLAAGQWLFRAPQERYEGRGFSFLVPEGWTCQTPGDETVCRPVSQEVARRAIIVAAWKTIGSNDAPDFFETYLRTPHTPAQRGDTPAAASEIVYVRPVTIAGREWLDSVHRGSLLPGYGSRYLVTTIGATSLLITLSFHDDVFDDNAGLMDAFADSIRLRGAR